MKQFEPLFGKSGGVLIDLAREDSGRAKGKLKVRQVIPTVLGGSGNQDDGSVMEVSLASGKALRVRTRLDIGYADPVGVTYDWYGVIPGGDSIEFVRLIDKQGKMIGEVRHNALGERPNGDAWVSTPTWGPTRWEFWVPHTKLPVEPYSQWMVYRIIGDSHWQWYLPGNNLIDRRIQGHLLELVAVIQNGLRPFEIHYQVDFTKVALPRPESPNRN